MPVTNGIWTSPGGGTVKSCAGLRRYFDASDSLADARVGSIVGIEGISFLLTYVNGPAVAGILVQWIGFLPQSADRPSLLLHPAQPSDSDGSCRNHFQFGLGKCKISSVRCHDILAICHEPIQIAVFRVGCLIP